MTTSKTITLDDHWTIFWQVFRKRPLAFLLVGGGTTLAALIPYVFLPGSLQSGWWLLLVDELWITLNASVALVLCMRLAVNILTNRQDPGSPIEQVMRAVGAEILLILFAVPVILILSLIVMAWSSTGPIGRGLYVLSVIYLLYVLILLLRSSLFLPFAVVEYRGPLESLTRSRALTKGHVAWAAVAQLVPMALSYGLWHITLLITSWFGLILMFLLISLLYLLIAIWYLMVYILLRAKREDSSFETIVQMLGPVEASRVEVLG